MARSFSLIVGFLLCFSVFSLGPTASAHAAGAEDFITTQGITGASAAVALAKQATSSGSGFGKIVGNIGKFFSDNKKALTKNLHLGVIEEIIDVGKALLGGDLREAAIQLAGGLANLLIEYGIPALAGAACTAIGSPAAGVACMQLAQRVIAETGLDDKVEKWVEDKLRNRGNNDTGDRRRRRGENDNRYDGNIDLNVDVKDVLVSAKGKSSAVSDIGVARAGNAKVSVDVDRTVSTTAKGRSNAYTGIGVATGDGARINVDVEKGVSTSAKGRSSASTEIGVSNGGRVNVIVGGAVNTQSSGSGSASTVIGTSSGGSSNVRVGGTVTTLGKNGADASTNIGTGKSAFVRGNVLNKSGDLSIGGACRARRDGKCCIDIHRGWCVLRMVPSDKGRCPPRYELSGGLCYLYSDKKHKISR